MSERTYEIDGVRYDVVIHDHGQSMDIFNAETGEHMNEGEPWFTDVATVTIEEDIRWLIENRAPR